MSVARGILTGFLKEGLEQKAARDEMYADMVRETGQEFRKTAQLFRKEEQDIEKRFKIIEADLGTPAALYASYNGLTTSDAGTDLILKRLNNPENAALKKQIEEFDFQGYDFSTAKSSRFMNFKDQQKDVINLITKNQGSGPVAELFFKDMQSMDTDTQVTRPELQLPALSDKPKSFNDFTALPINEKRQLRSDARSEFDALARDKNTKRFKDSFAEGYDPDKHGPNKDEYAFNNYFRNNYLPKVYSIPFKSPGRFEEDSRVNLAQDAINRARATGNEEAVEAIKQQLREDLGISNLGELIK
tara:strand:+ start:117 stop:1022 length:906 start_codon:yes stop_codon:yes gene_type:complete